jgi:hypothetical protein
VAELERAKYAFHASLVGTYPELAFEVTGVRPLAPLPAALRAKHQRFLDALPPGLPPPQRAVRHVFHTCKPGVTALIEREGMRPQRCGICLGDTGVWTDHDNGFFGDHSQGVYVSKHADYTFYYQNDRRLRVGDEGEVLVLELVTGRVMGFAGREDGAAPSADHDCHESPSRSPRYHAPVAAAAVSVMMILNSPVMTQTAKSLERLGV